MRSAKPTTPAPRWIELDTPLAIEWKGLPQPVKAPKTVLSVAPAKTLVWSTLNPADVRFALLLWNEAAGSPQRQSTLEFESLAGSVVVHISQPDLEAVIFNGRAIGHFDRPLAADGGRLAIRMPTAWYAVAELATDTIVGVIGHDPKAQTRPHVAFALENAFIKARSPVWLHLTGPLNAAGIERGLLLLRFPFRFVLPTLPDPYASSIDVPVRTDVDIGWASASVVWPNLDAASLGFTVLPAEAQQGALTTFNTQLVAGRGTAPTVPVLLDVSSNANQFGVAIPPQLRTGSSLQVQGMSLVAEARHVAVITLPPISWEPMLTKTPEPGATSDVPLPPPPHDGGPAFLTADVVELRPVEPVPLLRAYHEAIRDRRHFNARLPLPFGLIANLNSRGNAGDAAESQFKGTVFMNRPRFDGLTGGRQLALKGEPGVPQQRDPTMPGFLDAEMQDDYAKGVLSENLLTGVVTDFGRGSERRAGPPLRAVGLRREPVQRLARSRSRRPGDHPGPVRRAHRPDVARSDPDAERAGSGARARGPHDHDRSPAGRLGAARGQRVAADERRALCLQRRRERGGAADSARGAAAASARVRGNRHPPRRGVWRRQHPQHPPQRRTVSAALA